MAASVPLVGAGACHCTINRSHRAVVTTVITGGHGGGRVGRLSTSWMRNILLYKSFST
jgi:hypothetical protein